MGLLIQTLSELLEQFPNPPEYLPEVSLTAQNFVLILFTKDHNVVLHGHSRCPPLRVKSARVRTRAHLAILTIGRTRMWATS